MPLADIVLEEFREMYPDYEVIYVTISGSKLYGTDNENSDVDYKGLFIPPERDVLLKRDIEHFTSSTGDDKTKNGADDIDIQLWSIHKFMNLLEKGETGAMDLLFSMHRQDTIVLQTMRSDMLKSNTCKFLHSEVRSFIGYCVGQSKKYNIKGARYQELKHFLAAMASGRSYYQLLNDHSYEYVKLVMAPGSRGSGHHEDVEYIEVLGKKFLATLDREYVQGKLEDMEMQYGNRAKSASSNIDYKALSHAVRVLFEVKELITAEHISFPLIEADYIKAVKAGNVPLEAVMNEIAKEMDVVDRELRSTTLPSKFNRNLADQFLLGYTI